MNKPSRRDIQVFIGGALAIMGFRALIWIPYDLKYAAVAAYFRIFGSLLVLLALPIGLGILFNRRMAIFWAQIYLWFNTVVDCIVLPLSFYLTPRRALGWNSAPELLVNLALLALLLWGGSQKFADPLNSTQDNQTT